MFPEGDDSLSCWDRREKSVPRAGGAALKRGAVPEYRCPILERLDIRTDRWLAKVESFDALSVRVVGKVKGVTRIAHSAKKHFLKGMTASPLTFIQPAPDPSG